MFLRHKYFQCQPNIFYKYSIHSAFKDRKGGSEILITPVYKNASNAITNTGKPWYGIIKKVGGGGNTKNYLTVAAYPVYGVIGNDNDTTYNPVATSGDKPGLMTVADKNKLDDIQNQANKTSARSDSNDFTTENSDSNTLNNADAVAKTEAYQIGSVTPGTNSGKIIFKGKDTTYGKATSSKYGLVKLGDNAELDSINPATKIYPVQATSDGNLGVKVPWTDNQKLPKTLLAVADANDSNSHTAVDKGPVYINTYNVTPGENSPSHNNAISIEGANGISVTADSGGNIKITGHEKPPILNTDNKKNSDDGNLVPKPSSTSTNLYLRADGVWYTPTNTQVKLNGKVKDNSHTNTVASNGSGNAAEVVVQSILAGTGITLECDKNTGALTIIGPESGQNVISGTGLRYVDDGTDRVISLKAATAGEIGGVKVGSLGTGAIGDIQGGDSSQTIYAPPASGKYYPIETVASGDHSGHAVVKIPDVPSPFYEEGTTDNDKFTFAIEQYNVAYYWGAPIFAFTGDKGGSAFNDSLTAYNDFMNNNMGHAISQEEVADITSSSFIGLTITCPSNVIFAQLDRPIYVPTSPGYTMNGSIISTIAEGKQQISIQNSNPAIGFPVDSITTSNPGYASLKFATDDQLDTNNNIISKGHTYNATVKITYSSGMYGAAGTYTADIII